jgi:hypothetical protein
MRPSCQAAGQITAGGFARRQFILVFMFVGVTDGPCSSFEQWAHVLKPCFGRGSPQHSAALAIHPTNRNRLRIF